MKTFIIIANNKSYLIDRSSISEAKQSAINVCDVSKEIIVREIKEVHSYSKININIK